MQQVLDFKWLQWAMHRVQYRLGWQGMVLIAMLVLIFCLLVGWMLPLQSALEVTRQELQAQQSLLHRHPQPQRQAVVSSEDMLRQELKMFDERFPDIQQLPDDLGALFQLAEQHGLQVIKGEYSLSEKKQGNVRQFEASLPVQGNYQAVKALVLSILKTLPNVALTELSFERGEAVESEVKTRLRLVFFIRKPS